MFSLSSVWGISQSWWRQSVSNFIHFNIHSVHETILLSVSVLSQISTQFHLLLNGLFENVTFRRKLERKENVSLDELKLIWMRLKWHSNSMQILGNWKDKHIGFQFKPYITPTNTNRWPVVEHPIWIGLTFKTHWPNLFILHLYNDNLISIEKNTKIVVKIKLKMPFFLQSLSNGSMDGFGSLLNINFHDHWVYRKHITWKR